MERILSLVAVMVAGLALAVVAADLRCDCEHGEPQAIPPVVASTAAPPEPTTSTQGIPPQSSTLAPATAPPVLDQSIVGIDASAPDPNWQKPPVLETRADHAYGTPVTRMTSADGTRFNRNTYSRRNPENADGSMFLTYHGDATYNVYLVETGELVAITDIHPDGDPQWHPSDPDKLRYLAGNDSYAGDLLLYESDVREGSEAVIADLGPLLDERLEGARYLSDRAEGTPSRDGDRYAWLVFDDQEDVIGVVTYDLSTNTLGGVRSVDQLPEGRADFVSVSPTGAYVVLAGESGVFVYDYELETGRQIHDKAEHSDIALSASGEDVYVHVDFSAASPTAGWVVGRNLATGTTTRYFDLYDDANTSIHFSAKAYDAPGWIVASTYNCKESFAWSCEKVFLFNLDSGVIVNLAHTYNCGQEYWTETHAAANRDLSRVYFNSDGGTCGIDAEVYRIDVGRDRLLR